MKGMSPEELRQALGSGEAEITIRFGEAIEYLTPEEFVECIVFRVERARARKERGSATRPTGHGLRLIEDPKPGTAVTK